MSSALAHHAAKITAKPSKKELFALVQSLADKHPEECKELSALYLHFLPAQTKAKTGFAWVAQACAPLDFERKKMSYVYVTDEWITASDGHRLHRLRNHEGMMPGWYNHIGDYVYSLSEGDDIHRYPDVARAMGYKRWDEKTTDVVIKELPIKNDHYYAVPIGDGIDIHLNKMFFNDAVRGRKAVTLHHCNADDVTRIEDGDYVAAVMPVRH